MNMAVNQAFVLFVEEPDVLPDFIGSGLVSSVCMSALASKSVSFFFSS